VLLFSTVLQIQDSLSKDDFIKLVLQWNQRSPHPANVIPGIVWNGEHNTRYGNENMWLAIEEYRNKNTIAVRYEKVEDDGVIWDTDYVMNFDERKMAIQLDRSFLAEASTVDTKFSTPHFISLLSDGGYLTPDGQLPVSRLPVDINKDNLDVVAGVINGETRYKLPVVYISKLYNGSTPVDVRKLASKLKGVAHVLVQNDSWLNSDLRKLCYDKNEFNGAVGIYFPNPAVPHSRFFYRAYDGYDEFLYEKIVRSVIQYGTSQNVEPLYTWQGVNSSLLRDRWSSRGADLLEAERARKSAEFAHELAEEAKDEAERLADEANMMVASVDEEILSMKQQIQALSKDNERLAAENQGLRAKLSTLDDVPVLRAGNEDEFFPGEIKEIVLSILEEAGKNVQPKSRRADVIHDLISSNDYQGIMEKRAETLKTLLKGYSRMSSTLRHELEELGFTITEDGKHYRLTYYGDARYNTTLSKTGSDYHGGRNANSQITNSMF